MTPAAPDRRDAEPSAPPPFRLSVQGTHEAVPNARRALSRWLEGAGAGGKTLDEVGLVLTEICNNAIDHGSCGADRPMQVAAEISGGSLLLAVLEGNGVAAEPLRKAFEGAQHPPDVQDERGRGLFLVRAYVDDLRVDTTASGRLRIAIRKNLSQ